MADDLEFKPNDKTRELLKGLGNADSDKAMEQFFELWEAEGDPRRAGSIMAHRLVTLGARFAVFGAMCGGHEPDINLWMAVCRQRGEEAIAEVVKVFTEVDGAR